MAWLGAGGLGDLAADLKQKTDLEPENIEIEKLDDETLERLKQSTNLNDKEIETRHEEFNKMFPNRKGGNLAIMLEDFCQKKVKTGSCGFKILTNALAVKSSANSLAVKK